MKQLVINGKKSYDDFGVCIATRKISQPKKKTIKESVPFSNVTYDFSKIDGEIYWEERTLTYTFDIAEFTTEEMEDVKGKLLDWLLNVHDADIYDPYIPDYHFHGSYDSDSWDEDFGSGTLNVSFTVYPYKISNENENIVEKIGVSEDGNVKENFIGLKIDGKSVQNGTPTPDAPIEIKSFDCTNIIANKTNIPFKLTLRSLPNGVCDTYKNGKITRKVGCITFNGSEEWGVQGSNYYSSILEKRSNYEEKENVLICSHFNVQNYMGIAMKGHITEMYYHTGNRNVLLNYDNSSGGVENFKTWLRENPVTIYYELRTPTVETLELPTISSNVVISFDSALDTTFEVYYDETKKVSIYNDSSHRISPTIIVNGSFTITMNNTSFTVSDGTYEETEFYLESGLNEVSISGYGTITFAYKGEKF